MNTNLLKKGRLAMAWLIIITMVFATMSTPFAYAKPADPPAQPTPDTAGITFDLSTFEKPDGTVNEGLLTYRISDEADFIIFKQGSLGSDTQVSYLWTPLSIDPTLQQDIVNQLVYWANYYPGDKDGSLKDLKLSDLQYIYGFGTKGIYGYSILHDELNKEFVIVANQDQLSHITFGSYGHEEEELGQINVTKEVAWTEDSINPVPITKTFRAGLFTMVNDAYELVQIGGEDAIVELNVDNSQPAEATFDNLPLDQTYYVFEIDEDNSPIATDENGNLLPLVNEGWVTLKYTSNPIELTEADVPGEITITNYFKDLGVPYEAGEITVTKEVTVLSDDPNTKVTHVFHVALFEDQDGKMVKVADDKDLSIVGSVSTSVTFEELSLDKTYYVFETDDSGNIIQTNDGTIVTPILKDWIKIGYTNPIISLTSEKQTGESTINNVFDTRDQFFDPSIKVIKTVTVNNVPTASNLTFYAGLFEDKELTKLVAFKPLPMKGTATADASFAFYQDGVTPLKVGATYYVAETNDQGKPLAGTAKELGFEITINGVTNNNSTVVLIEEEAVVNIVNNFKKEEFPLTGDNSNMNLWLFLAMLGVAGAIAPFAFRKKEEAND